MSSDEITKEDLINRFSVYDYIVCLAMLGLSAGIGVFYGCFGRKMQDTKEFLMAGKSMGTFPVAMSLIASFMSAIALLGIPSEVYTNGVIFYLSMLCYIILMPITAYLYLPVFWNLQLTSVYEYLEIRFSKPVRKLGSLLFILQILMYMAIVVYAPSLALAQVTGINVYVSVTTIFVVCIFYTTLGGLKAVLWTDTLQTVIMYATMILIVSNGFIDGGGIKAVWEANVRGNRTTLIDWDLNPTTRHTIWSLVIGMFFGWLPIFGVSQAQIQRYLCVRKKEMAIRAIWITMVGFIILVSTTILAGLLIYAKYENCDPVKSGLVSKGDQLLPLYVMDTLGKWYGLHGFFVAGIFSGSLSTVSSGINSLATIILEDFIKGGPFPNITERTATTLSKMLSILYGLLSLGLVFIAERMGNVISASISVSGTMGGPLLGIFTLGMFCPWANSLGAFFGTLLGFALTLWICIGYQINAFYGNIKQIPLPVNTFGCMNFNSTIEEAFKDVTPLKIEDSKVLSIYKVSYLWYSIIGFIATLIFGMLISLLTGSRDVRTLNPTLLSPLIHWIKFIIPKGREIGMDYKEKANEIKEKMNIYSIGITNDEYSVGLRQEKPKSTYSVAESTHL